MGLVQLYIYLINTDVSAYIAYMLLIISDKINISFSKQFNKKLRNLTIQQNNKTI